MQNVIANSGPLGVLLNKRDQFHARAVVFFPVYGAALRCRTTWGVVSEVMYFLDFNVDAQGDSLDWVHAGHARGLMTITALDPTDLPGLSKLVRKYADRPMDLADASLVWLANKTDITDIITVDRADFSLYRTNKRKAFRNVFVV